MTRSYYRFGSEVGSKMKMTKYLAIFLSLSLALGGCATPYKGSPPDLSLKGDAAKAEYEKFKLEESYWDQGYFLTMGPERIRYTLPSMEPVVEKVSPQATEKLAQVHDLRTAQNIVFGVVLACAVVSLLSPSNSLTRDSLAPAVFVGTMGVIGANFVMAGFLSSASKQYNQDLRDKLIPGVNVSLNFP